MFSGTNLKPGLPARQQGYSLFELAASLLLIAAIAVLALPTYQDFSPHVETLQGGAAQASVAEVEASVTDTTKSPDENQRMSPSQSKEAGDLNVEDPEMLADG